MRELDLKKDALLQDNLTIVDIDYEKRSLLRLRFFCLKKRTIFLGKALQLVFNPL